jgi:hypothetical protein
MIIFDAIDLGADNVGIFAPCSPAVMAPTVTVETA